MLGKSECAVLYNYIELCARGLGWLAVNVLVNYVI